MTPDILTIYIGYDSKEAAAFHTLFQSLIEHATRPIKVVPVCLDHLSSIYFREHDSRQSNDFSFSRFLVPYLNQYSGYAVFMDCDMLLTCDIYSIFEEITDYSKAVWVVQHDYKSKVDTKYLGNKQYNYPRKNWSSFVVWNCAHPDNKFVTPEYIRDADAATLHRFYWLSDEQIGSLPTKWNFLVGEYEVTEVIPNNIHWTLGGPYFEDYADADYNDLWDKMFKKVIYTRQLNER